MGALACALCAAAPALATVGWSVHSVADPTHFYPGDAEGRYQVVVLNVGDTEAGGPITVKDELPMGLTGSGGSAHGGPEGEKWSCSAGATVVCTLNEPVVAGGYPPTLEIAVSGLVETSGALVNKVTVEGGETMTTPAALTSEENEINVQAPPFGIASFSFRSAERRRGRVGRRGRYHPGAVSTRVGFADIFRPPGRLADLAAPATNRWNSQRTWWLNYRPALWVIRWRFRAVPAV